MSLSFSKFPLAPAHPGHYSFLLWVPLLACLPCSELSTASPLPVNLQVANFQRCERVSTCSVTKLVHLSGAHCHLCVSSMSGCAFVDFTVVNRVQWGFPGGSAVKNPPAVQRSKEKQVRSLGREDPLEEGMKTHTSVLAWRIPWMEEPGGPQSIGSVEHDRSNLAGMRALSTVVQSLCFKPRISGNKCLTVVM